MRSVQPGNFVFHLSRHYSLTSPKNSMDSVPGGGEKNLSTRLLIQSAMPLRCPLTKFLYFALTCSVYTYFLFLIGSKSFSVISSIEVDSWSMKLILSHLTPKTYISTQSPKFTPVLRFGEQCRQINVTIEPFLCRRFHEG